MIAVFCGLVSIPVEQASSELCLLSRAPTFQQPVRHYCYSTDSKVVSFGAIRDHGLDFNTLKINPEYECGFCSPKPIDTFRRRHYISHKNGWQLID
jgi:hypothetical protein